jgi:hypothetical protein
VRGARPVPSQACESVAQPSLRVKMAVKPWLAKAYPALAADPQPRARESVRLERLRWRGGVR